MKGKSLVVQIFTLLISAITIYGNLLPVSILPWLGIVAFSLTGILNSPLLSSGKWPTGWAPVMWITTITGLAIQIGNEMATQSLVDPAIINNIVVGINLLLFTFVKDYKTETSIVR